MTAAGTLWVTGTKHTLVPRPGAGTTKLLRLTPSVVGDEQGTIVGDQCLLQLVLAVLVDEFLVVGYDALGDGLTDGVDLRSVTSSGDADTDVDASELVEANDEEGLVDLEAEDLGLNKVDGGAIYFNESAAGLEGGISLGFRRVAREGKMGGRRVPCSGRRR